MMSDLGPGKVKGGVYTPPPIHPCTCCRKTTIRAQAADHEDISGQFWWKVLGAIKNFLDGKFLVQ